MSVEIGDTVPSFSLPATGGRTVSSDALRGRPYVLYFYPKADTPGCTKEACEFQEALPGLGKLKIEVIGVSKDKIPALEKFADKFGLKFPLASDADGDLCEKFGVWVEKSMYGRKYWGIERATFLVDASGKVKQVWHKVSVTGHVAEVAKASAA